MKPKIRKVELSLKEIQNRLDQIEMLKVLLAVEAGELSEGQACKLLERDRVALRGFRNEALKDVEKMMTELKSKI